MNLLSTFKTEDQIISLIGMAKNAGKTVVLNQLMSEAFAEGMPLGITSIGRDGERLDLVTETPKPLIYAYEGTKIATAEGLLHLCEAGLEILEVTSIGTALGKIIVANVKHEGYVQIAGPASNKDIRLMAEKMIGYGAVKVLIDGALDRSSSASPAIADSAILSTGAVLSRDMKRVVQLTKHKIDLFHLPRVGNEQLLDMATEIIQKHQVVIINQRQGNVELKPLHMKTALGTGQLIADEVIEETTHILISGSLVFATIKDVSARLKQPNQITWVVQDATKLFIDDKQWQELLRWGVSIEVIKPLKLVALTVNPYAPSGYYFNPESFLQEMSQGTTGLPVVDVVYGGWQCNS